MKMVGERRRVICSRFLSLLRNGKAVVQEKRRRTIVVGLKSDNSGRETLLRLINSVVMSGDYLIAVHVHDPDHDHVFDPNSFHLQEDICKSKQVDFQVKVCEGSCYITELSHQVRITSATILALGCNASWPNMSLIYKFLKELPPTCYLLVMNDLGRIVVELQGTSQQGSSKKVLRSSQSDILNDTNREEGWDNLSPIRKSSTMPTLSSASSLLEHKTEKTEFATVEAFERLDSLEKQGRNFKSFTLKELTFATDSFNPDFVIGEGANTLVYRADLETGETAAVKVFKSGEKPSLDDVFHELEMLSGLRHENIVQLIGYCYEGEICAIVYDLLSGDLQHRLKYLSWKERMNAAIGVAKALDYLHSCSPPIVHRDIKSSNILLSDDFQPRLSDFGVAVEYDEKALLKPVPVVGTFGYMAPEYMMYGKVDEKIDVYSYGVVLLELITGREALGNPKLQSDNDSLVVWARNLLSRGLAESLIDPELEEEYDKDEMKAMMVAARLCLTHSSSRRPTMKMILRLLEEPENLLELHKSEEFLNRINSISEKQTT